MTDDIQEIVDEFNDEPYTGTIHWRIKDTGDGAGNALRTTARKLVTRLMRDRADGMSMYDRDEIYRLADGSIIKAAIRDELVLVEITVPGFEEEAQEEEEQERYDALWAGIKYSASTVVSSGDPDSSSHYNPYEMPPLQAYCWEPAGATDFPPWFVMGSDQNSFSGANQRLGDEYPLFCSGSPVEDLDDFDLPYTLLPSDYLQEFCTVYRYLKINTDNEVPSYNGIYHQALNSQHEDAAGFLLGQANVVRTLYGLYMCSYGYAHDPETTNENYPDQPGNPDYWQYTLHLDENDPVKEFAVLNNFLTPIEPIGSYSGYFTSTGSTIDQPDIPITGAQEWNCQGQIFNGKYILVVWPGKSDECMYFASNTVLVRVRFGKSPGPVREIEFEQTFNDSYSYTDQYRTSSTENLPYGYYEYNNCNEWCPIKPEFWTPDPDRCVMEDVDCPTAEPTMNQPSGIIPGSTLIICIDVRNRDAWALGDKDDDPDEATLWPDFVKTTEYTPFGTWQDQPFAFADGGRVQLSCSSCSVDQLSFPEYDPTGFRHACAVVGVYLKVISVDGEGRPCRGQVQMDAARINGVAGPMHGARVAIILGSPQFHPNTGVAKDYRTIRRTQEIGGDLSTTRVEIGDTMFIVGCQCAVCSGWEATAITLFDTYYTDLFGEAFRGKENDAQRGELENFNVIGSGENVQIGGPVADSMLTIAGNLYDNESGSCPPRWASVNGAWTLYIDCE